MKLNRTLTLVFAAAIAPLSISKSARAVTAPAPTLTTLATFSGANGNGPTAGLTMDGTGNLFGTTFTGGSGGYGTVFELPTGSAAVTTLASFDLSNGRTPICAPVFDAGDNLFGTTASGGSNGFGTVFEIAATTHALSSVSFNGANGKSSDAGLIADGAGNFYGTTSQGGTIGDGTVFKFSPASGLLVALASFNGTNGIGPSSTLISDSAGTLYGTTVNGGPASYGTVFKIAPAVGAITTIGSFAATTARGPGGGVTFDKAGDLFGVTTSDASGLGGDIYEIPVGTNSVTVLATSNRAITGGGPQGGLIVDAAGNLFGTAVNGGANNDGTIFELPQGRTRSPRWFRSTVPTTG